LRSCIARRRFTSLAHSELINPLRRYHFSERQTVPLRFVSTKGPTSARWSPPKAPELADLVAAADLDLEFPRPLVAAARLRRQRRPTSREHSGQWRWKAACRLNGSWNRRRVGKHEPPSAPPLPKQPAWWCRSCGCTALVAVAAAAVVMTAAVPNAASGPSGRRAHSRWVPPTVWGTAVASGAPSPCGLQPPGAAHHLMRPLPRPRASPPVAPRFLFGPFLSSGARSASRRARPVAPAARPMTSTLTLASAAASELLTASVLATLTAEKTRQAYAAALQEFSPGSRSAARCRGKNRFRSPPIPMSSRAGSAGRMPQLLSETPRRLPSLKDST